MRTLFPNHTTIIGCAIEPCLPACLPAEETPSAHMSLFMVCGAIGIWPRVKRQRQKVWRPWHPILSIYLHAIDRGSFGLAHGTGKDKEKEEERKKKGRKKEDDKRSRVQNGDWKEFEHV